MDIRAELHWVWGAFTVIWRSLQRHLVGGMLHAMVWCMLSVPGKAAAKLAQVCMIPQVIKSALRSWAQGRGGLEDPVLPLPQQTL